MVWACGGGDVSMMDAECLASLGVLAKSRFQGLSISMEVLGGKPREWGGWFKQVF